jgi:glycosyltransferase involved in cell wall biosynthesis
VLFVGRLSREKNISGLLRAWATALPGLGGGWKLVIVGDGPMSKALVDEAQALAVESTVHFSGLQNNIPEWLASASIYVSSSLCEGLSNSLLEAMACGLPVVVTRVSGALELVDETDSGFVVPVGDSGALASALNKLAGSKQLRQEMGARGRCVIEKRYAIDRVTALHEGLYARLLQRSGGTRNK